MKNFSRKFISYSRLLPPLPDFGREQWVGEAGEEVCMIGCTEKYLIKMIRDISRYSTMFRNISVCYEYLKPLVSSNRSSNSIVRAALRSQREPLLTLIPFVTWWKWSQLHSNGLFLEADLIYSQQNICHHEDHV